MKIKALSLLIFMACSPLLMAQSGMTDQQVLEYAKDGVKQGKDQRTIATELARRGVTREQAERVKKLYEQQTNTDSNNLTGTAKAEARLRQQTQEDNSTMLDEKPQAQEVAQQDAVFGRNIFNTRNLTFEPNVNIATPPNYRLGPGDEVVIDIWGASQNTIRQQISPDGTINLEQLGPVFLSGMTVDRAQQYLTDELRKIYSDQSNQIRVTLGNTRTIQINVMGEVVQPGTYALSAFSTVFHALYRAGGVSNIGSLRNVKVSRGGKIVATVDVYQFIMQGKTRDDTDYSVCKMHDGDVVTAEAILDRFTNKLEVRGAVYRPGIYELGGKLNTMRELVNKADGLMADAFTGRAVLYRERENKTREVKQIDIRAIMEGTQPDIPLQKNDVLYIPSIHDLEDLGNVQIFGEVAHPGDYPYADNMTLEDLVITAGGLRESASVVRVDVARRVKDPKSTESSATIGQTFSFGLKDGFVVDGEPGFTLQPYDQVFVRRSPGYSAQQNVTVNGEVLYGGTYALTSKSERISSIIAKAGGATPFAYVKGAKLTRVANEEEIKRMEDVVNLLRRQVGDAMIDSLGINVQNTFTVGIDLEEALANPGSDADIVLREGDVITVPEYNNTVKIDGAVMMPNTVSYKEGESVKYYISQAGGYGQNAKKSKKFIIYMNGQIAEVKGGGKSQIEPGCEIIVPSKRKKQFNIGNLVGLTSSVASLATLATAITALVK